MSKQNKPKPATDKTGEAIEILQNLKREGVKGLEARIEALKKIHEKN